ncbi:MAG: Obg family GTPase CgtA, partial [Acidimicrobiales bacterium]
VATTNQASLLGFRDHPHRRAGNGGHGSGKRRHGPRGADLEVPVPVGTVVRDRGGGVLCDLSGPGDRWLAAEGGRGGRGNARFLSNSRRAPAFAEQGERGQERWLDAELKLVADVALVGFPNVGKSTLIATVSAAKPKIADYPFTTLEPHLGVVRADDDVELVLADVPGLVEGAADGRGLGHRFLRHIERARALLVLLDLASETPPAEQLRVLERELGRYEPELLRRPRLVVGSKADVAGVDGAPVALAVSAPTGRGVAELVRRMALIVTEAREADAVEPGEVVVHRPVPEGIRVERVDAGVWAVVGREAERAVSFSDMTDDGALDESARRLRRLGVDRLLARAGAREGDEVHVGGVSFTWYRS